MRSLAAPVGHREEITLTQTFNYNSSEVRTLIIDGEPWFVLADVCKVLDIKHPQNFLRSPRCVKDGVCSAHPIADALGRVQEATLINERNLYALVGRSDKPEAMAFMDWVYGEVLPQIRRSGTYRAPLGIDDDPILAALGAITEMRKGQIALEKRVDRIEGSLKESYASSLALPPATETPRPLTTRELCNKGIAELVRQTERDYEVCWNAAVFAYNRQARTNLSLIAKNKHLGRLDYLEKYGGIEMMYAVIREMVEASATAGASVLVLR